MGLWELCQGEDAGNPNDAEHGHDEEDPTRDDRRVDHPSIQLSNLCVDQPSALLVHEREPTFVLGISPSGSLSIASL